MSAGAPPGGRGDGQGASARELDAFRTLMLPHMDAAYSYARFLSRDAAAAEDLVQDAYLKAFRGFAFYRGGDARAWLFAIVRSGFLDSVRGRREPVGADEEIASAADPADTPEEALIRATDAAAVRAAVEALPEPFRETLVLRELEEMSYRDIGALMKVPLGTIMSRLSRARRMLAAALAGGETS